MLISSANKSIRFGTPTIRYQLNVYFQGHKSELDTPFPLYSPLYVLPCENAPHSHKEKMRVFP